MNPPDGTLRLIPSRSLSRLKPIDRLPDEMLVAIFREYMEMHWCDMDQMRVSKTGVEGLYRWVRVSHVNKLWRDVALRWPSLWSRIILPWKNFESLPEFLSRSKKSPLHVRLWGNPTEPRCVALDLVRQHSHRLATLEFKLVGNCLSSSRWHSFITEGLVNSELLTRCNLRIPSYRVSTLPALHLKSAPVSHRLTHLETKGFPFSMVRRLCQPNIVSLSITFGREDISIPLLLSVLSTMSSLTQLSIYMSKHSGAMEANSTTEVPDVLLPQLSMLKLSSSHVGSGILLDHLVLPSTTKYEIDIGKNSSGFMQALERKLQGNKVIGVRPPFRYGQLSLPTANSLGVGFWRVWAAEIPFEGDSLSEDTPLLCLRLFNSFDTGNRGPELVLSLLSNSGLRLSELKALEVSPDCVATECDSWVSFFTLTPHLEDLSLTGTSYGLRHAFLGLARKVGPAESARILLPHLRTLSVGLDTKETIETIPLSVHSLWLMFKSRMHSYPKVQKLMINGLPEPLPMSAFELLEELVQVDIDRTSRRYRSPTTMHFLIK